MDKIKICNKCKTELPSTVEFFSTRGNRLRAQCRLCMSKHKKKYYKKNKKRIAIYLKDNKNKLAEKHKKYRLKNVDKMKAKAKIYYNNNREKFKERRLKNKKYMIKYNKNYYIKNKETINNLGHIYYVKNKEHILKRTKANSKKKLYKKINTNSKKFKTMSLYNETKINKFGVGQAKCAYCGKWTTLTNGQVCNRVASCEGKDASEGSNIYCSESCKTACPTFNMTKYQKGFKKASSREANPLIRQMCFEYDNYECQKCGATQEDEQLHCHHIQGAAKEPLLANDIDNVITLCKTCHKWVHAQIDCGYTDYKRQKCVEA